MKDEKTLQTLLHMVSFIECNVVKKSLLTEIKRCQRILEMDRIYEETKHADVQ